jgi:hypothetical protein
MEDGLIKVRVHNWDKMQLGRGAERCREVRGGQMECIEHGYITKDALTQAGSMRTLFLDVIMLKMNMSRLSYDSGNTPI